MTKLKSKTGCVTCLSRKKKCDEGIPQCGSCRRLGLACVTRRSQIDKSIPVSSTNMRDRSLHPRAAPSAGYPSFRSDWEQQVVLGSSKILLPLASRMADPVFNDVALFGRLCVQDLLVRDSMVAFAAFGKGQAFGDSYKLSLRSYQNCVTSLKDMRAHQIRDSRSNLVVLTTVCFLGLLEGLQLGDPANALAHFEACGELLVRYMSETPDARSSELILMLRVIAECMVFNLATLSAFCPTKSILSSAWGSINDRLFYGGDSTMSPFLGGLQGVYRIMLEINTILYRDRRHSQEVGSDDSRTTKLQMLSQDLDHLERQIATMYPGRAGHDQARRLYEAKHRLSIIALRIHLHKVKVPSTTSTDPRIQLHVSNAIAILKRQNICEPGNPALRWPLTIFACAASDDADFEFLVSRMNEMEQILDPSNRQKLKSAYAVLRRRRCTPGFFRFGSYYDDRNIQRIDFLLQPWKLVESRSDERETVPVATSD